MRSGAEEFERLYRAEYPALVGYFLRRVDGPASWDGSYATSDEQAEDVRAVLSTLRPAEQEVLMLTYWDGLSAREIAPVLGITRSAVWVRLHRARQAFATAWAAEPLPASTP